MMDAGIDRDSYVFDSTTSTGPFLICHQFVTEAFRSQISSVKRTGSNPVWAAIVRSGNRVVLVAGMLDTLLVSLPRRRIDCARHNALRTPPAFRSCHVPDKHKIWAVVGGLVPAI